MEKHGARVKVASSGRRAEEWKQVRRPTREEEEVGHERHTAATPEHRHGAI
jgi:hypothetical protein